jgi:general secretion pathway protein A
VRGIHRYTRGIPRLVNVLCDRMMLGAYSRNLGRTDLGMLRIAAREVLGEEAADSRMENGRFWPFALVGAVLLGAAVAWWWHTRQVPVAPEVAPAAAAPVPQNWEPVVTPPTAIDANPDQGPETETTTVIPVPSELDKTTSAGDWLLSPQDALTQLWSLYSPVPAPADLCTGGPLPGGLACIEGTAQTWDELAGLDRPLFLDMITPERFGAGVLFLGNQGRNAWVLNNGRVSEVELVQLGPAWTGDYRLLWHPPEGFIRPLGVGDNSAAVAEVAALFARLDGQSQALAGTRFTPALQTRVRLFQREQGLEDDGVVGVQTLLRLNEATGVDITAARARQLLEPALLGEESGI